MEFRFQPSELELISYARDAVRARLPIGRFRRAEGARSAWASLGADGWLHAGIGEEGEPVELSVQAGIARETGRVLATEEFVQNGYLIPALCARLSVPSERTQWLEHHRTQPGYVVGLPTGPHPWGEHQAAVTKGAAADFDFYEVSGRGTQRSITRIMEPVATVVPVGELALSASRSSISGGSTLEAQLNLPPAECTRITGSATLLRCAGLVGTASEILSTTVAYVGDRVQFGQPIGKFQAVKHLCADVYVAVEVAWQAVLYASVAMFDDLDSLDEACVRTASAALEAARIGAQLHGGMGFTWESDLHWLLKGVLDAQIGLGGGTSSAYHIGQRLIGLT